LFCAVGPLLQAQEATRSAADDYEMEYSSYFASLDFVMEKDKLVARYFLEKEILYTGDKNIGSNTQSINYSDFYSKDVQLLGFVLTPKKNGKYKTKKVKLFYEKTITSSGIFYEDQIRQTCVYPGVKVGSKTILRYSSTLTDPVLSPRLLFNHELNGKQIVYKINVPNFLKVKMAFYGDTSGIAHQSVNTPTSVIHTYSCTNRPAINFEDNSTNLTYYTPHLVVVPESYTLQGVETKLAGTIANLFKRYNKHIQEIKISENAELNRITDSLVTGKSDTLSRITAVYNWVQKNIKYVAFEEGAGGFVPRPADKIVANRYGDCKDKANVLVTMMNRAGIPCYYTWIGSRNKPYTYSEMPSPHSDDHMIAAIRYKNNWSFMDATAQDIEFGLPSSFIQGKEAFIRLSDTTYTIQKVPVILASRSVKADSLLIQINKETIEGKGTRVVSGYVKETYHSLINNAKKGTDEIIGRYDIGNNKVSINNFKLSAPDDRDITIRYDFTLPNYLQKFNNEIYLNLNLLRDYERDFIELEKRKLDIEEDYQYTLSQHVQLAIPADKDIVSVPKDISYEGQDFSFTILYKKEGQRLLLDKTITINHLVLKKEKFADWNAMIDKLSKAYSEVVIIKDK
jgi:hypothetical protein